MAYIPSRRVLAEGGYEGGGAMVYYCAAFALGPQRRRGDHRRRPRDAAGCELTALRTHPSLGQPRLLESRRHVRTARFTRTSRRTSIQSQAQSVTCAPPGRSARPDRSSSAPARSANWATSSRRLGLKRVLIVTDARLVEAGICDEVQRPLRRSRRRSTCSPAASPSRRCAWPSACIAHAREFRPDGLIGLGGGSNMDLAKMAATVLAHGGTPRDYLGEDRVPGPVAAADLHSHHLRHRQRGLGLGRVHRRGQSHQGRRDEQLSAAARWRSSIRG